MKEVISFKIIKNDTLPKLLLLLILQLLVVID